MCDPNYTELEPYFQSNKGFFRNYRLVLIHLLKIAFISSK